jgi:hypothetical protein
MCCCCCCGRAGGRPSVAGEIYRHTGGHLRHYTNPDIAGAGPKLGVPKDIDCCRLAARSRHGGQEGGRDGRAGGQVHRWRGEIYRYTGDHLRHYTNLISPAWTQTGRPRRDTAPACRTVPPWRPRRRTRRKGRRSSASVAGRIYAAIGRPPALTRTQISPCGTQTGRPPKDTRLRGVPHGRSWRPRESGRGGRQRSSASRGNIYRYTGGNGTTRTQISPARGTPSGVPEGHRLRRRTHTVRHGVAEGRGESLSLNRQTLAQKSKMRTMVAKEGIIL